MGQVAHGEEDGTTCRVAHSQWEVSAAGGGPAHGLVLAHVVCQEKDEGWLDDGNPRGPSSSEDERVEIDTVGQGAKKLSKITMATEWTEGAAIDGAAMEKTIILNACD